MNKEQICKTTGYEDKKETIDTRNEGKILMGGERFFTKEILSDKNSCTKLLENIGHSFAENLN